MRVPEEVAPVPFSMAFMSSEEDPPSDPGLLPDSEHEAMALPVAQPLTPAPTVETKRKTKRRKKKKKKKKVSDSSQLKLLAIDKDCPNCKAVVAEEVVVCTHCGYNFETRQKPAKAMAPKPKQRKALTGAQDYLRNLERMGWASLTPIGLILGPYVLFQSLFAGEYARGLRSKAQAKFSGSILQVRVVGTIATLLWISVGVYLATIDRTDTGRRKRPKDTADDSLGQQVRDDLKGLALGFRSALKASKNGYPPQTIESRYVIRNLKKRLLIKSIPRCPGTADGFAGDFDPVFRKDTLDSRWLFWTPNPFESGGKSIQVAVTLGGRIETYDAADWRKAFERAQARKGNTASGNEEDDVGFSESCERLIKLAAENPEAITDDEFTQRIGLGAAEMLSLVLRNPGGKEQLVSAACSLLEVVVLDSVTLKRLAEQAALSKNIKHRFSAALTLRRIQEPSWCKLAAEIFKQERSSEQAQTVLRWVLAEFNNGADAVQPIIAAAAALRENASDPALYPIPKERYVVLMELFHSNELYPEICAILYNNEEVSLGLLDQAMNSDSINDRMRVLNALSEFPKLQDEAALLRIITRRLQSADEVPKFRIAALQRLSRVPDARVIRLAAQQYDYAPEQLEEVVLEIFESGLRNPDLQLEVLAALESKAAAIAVSALKGAFNKSLLKLLAKKASTIKDTDACLAVMDLLKKKSGDDVVNILETYAGRNTTVVRNRALYLIKVLPLNPRDKNLTNTVTRTFIPMLRRREKDERLQLLAVELLGDYQSNKGLKALERFIFSDHANVKTRQRALQSLTSYNSFKCLDALVRIHEAKPKKMPKSLRNLAERGLRNKTVGRADDWKAYIKANRSRISDRLDELERVRQSKLERYEKTAEDKAKNNF